ncbi:MAG TPA: hypothetical protein VFQ43_15910, partial [Nitrososphaera sp.]|nr:hypothetical protein [Nitrososphaera sp.]
SRSKSLLHKLSPEDDTLEKSGETHQTGGSAASPDPIGPSCRIVAFPGELSRTCHSYPGTAGRRVFSVIISLREMKRA